MEEGNALKHMINLHSGAVETLSCLKSKGYNQIIISAMCQTDLSRQINNVNVTSIFNDIVGIKDIYAKGKIDIAKRYIVDNKINVEDSCMIGDTFHYYEVLKAIG